MNDDERDRIRKVMKDDEEREQILKEEDKIRAHARLTPKPKKGRNWSTQLKWLYTRELEAYPYPNRRDWGVVHERWVQRIADALDPDLLGLPLVALDQTSGKVRYLIIDGLQRIRAVDRALGPGQKIRCEVITGLDPSDIPKIYRGGTRGCGRVSKRDREKLEQFLKEQEEAKEKK
jgi:hypothetical protein